MKRKSFKESYGNPDAILTGDWHIREDIPVSRVDDFMLTQRKKLSFIRKMQKEFNCPVLHSGDVFNYWKVNPFLISFALTYFPSNIIGVYGNHDLPRHSYKLRKESALYALEKAGIFEEQGLSYGNKSDDFESLDDFTIVIKGRRILVRHVFVYRAKREFWYGDKAVSARALIEKFPDVDLIVTGDNHQSFVEEYDGRLVVNPGCLLREKLNEKDYQPTIYLWYADQNKVVPVVVPHNHDNIQETYSLKKESQDRAKAFIERIEKLGDSISVNFDSNLRLYFQKNKTTKLVEEIVFKAIESN